MTHITDHELEYMVRWAASNGATIQLEGEVGFGRECVGVLVGTHYPAYDCSEMGFKPDDAYHKHDCLAVLGRGPNAERQLYEWIRWIDEHDGKIVVVDRKADNAIDLLFHGVTQAKVVF